MNTSKTAIPFPSASFVKWAFVQSVFIALAILIALTYNPFSARAQSSEVQAAPNLFLGGQSSRGASSNAAPPAFTTIKGGGAAQPQPFNLQAMLTAPPGSGIRSASVTSPWQFDGGRQQRERYSPERFSELARETTLRQHAAIRAESEKRQELLKKAQAEQEKQYRESKERRRAQAQGENPQNRSARTTTTRQETPVRYVYTPQNARETQAPPRVFLEQR